MQSMIRILSIILILSTFHGETLASELLKVARTAGNDQVQLYLSFDNPPAFSTASNEKRVDLIFPQSTVSPKLNLIESDHNIVKFLTRIEKEKLVVSLFFRYKPQKYTLTKSSDDKIVFEVLLGNQYSRDYQNLAARLHGLTVLDRQTVDFTNPYILTPYKNDWMSFFSQYESPITINVPIKYSWPPFPIIRYLPPGKDANLQILSEEMYDLADKNLWELLGVTLLKAIREEKNVKKQKLYALTYGEVLARSYDFELAYKQLYLLKEKYHEELLGTFANFLLTTLRSMKVDPFLADYEYKEMEKLIDNNNPLAPYFLLTRIETALATSQYERLNSLLLIEDIALPRDVAQKIQIRQADYWYAIKKPVKAYASYLLLSESPLLRTMPYSLAGYCKTLYSQKKYQDAATCFDQLSSFTSDKNLLSLISYKKNMSQLKFTDSSSLIGSFSHIENAFPNTEGGLLASMKVTDLLFAEDKSFAPQALTKYGKISSATHYRLVAEESLFKKAIVHALLGENDLSINLLDRLLREFQKSEIRIPAQALLIEILPKEITRLVGSKRYIQALVLAKQHKDLFRKNWISNQFLVNIAEAYYKIGIFNEAQKLYLYLIEVMPIDRKERFFLPMIRATFDHGNYNLVEDYASQYFYNYPKGKDYNEILFLRLQSLLATNQLNEALRFLPSPLPKHPEMHSFAASLYFVTDDYNLCLVTLKKLSAIGEPFSHEQQLMFAESFFKTENFADAEKAYKDVKKENIFYSQSLYRLAELERKKGNEKKALILFEKIVEEGNSPRWKKYAVRELQYAKAATRM